jgi:hypothetical protein
MTRAELRERMSAQEFGQWVAIFLARPFDLHTLYELPQALIRATLIQLQGGKPKLDDLMWSKRNSALSLDDAIADMGKL